MGSSALSSECGFLRRRNCPRVCLLIGGDRCEAFDSSCDRKRTNKTVRPSGRQTPLGARSGSRTFCLTWYSPTEGAKEERVGPSGTASGHATHPFIYSPGQFEGRPYSVDLSHHFPIWAQGRISIGVTLVVAPPTAALAQLIGDAKLHIIIFINP